jgi:hypothetical protein
LVLRESVLDRTTFCYPDSTFGPTQFGTAQNMSLLDRWAGDSPPDPLDHYIEAHVHGSLTLQDVEALVLDPAQSTMGQDDRLTFPVRYHQGYRVRPEDIDPQYRGPEYVGIAHELAVEGLVTPAEIAGARGVRDEQILKRVWHCLARFGRDETC